MNRVLGVVMDPIDAIDIRKDSTFAMLLAAQRRGWSLCYFELGDLTLRDGRAYGRGRALEVRDDPAGWFAFGAEHRVPLDTLLVVLMRKDPPVDAEYLYATQLLDLARLRGTLVVNDPRALRDANEKLFIAHFPQCCPPHAVLRESADLRAFLREQGEIVVKPLDGMGGRSVFRVRSGDPNANAIFETLTERGRRFCMAQRFLPEIADGDKRVLVVDGVAVPFMLARIPHPDDSRGNLAAGARAEVRPLGARERWIVEQVAPALREHGIWFAGLDVIGDWLTEINLTSPTCIREIDRACGTDIAADLLAALECRL